MDCFLYDIGLRRERVKENHLFGSNQSGLEHMIRI